MKSFERYSLVWQQCGSNNLAERFWVPGYDGFLPFLISGDCLEALEAGKDVELTEFQLLAGILYGLYEFDNDPKPIHRNEDRHTLTYLLDVLRNGFNEPDPELFLLNAASTVRHKNGNRASRVMLQTALNLIPFSSKIRSDLICDTFAVAGDTDDESLLEPIPEWVRETTLSELLGPAKEIVCYYGLCSLVKTGAGNEEISEFLEEFVYPNVEMRALKIKIKSLLEHPVSFSIRDLELKTV